MAEGSLESTITEAVLCAVSAHATPSQRLQAYQVCESFKSSVVDNSQLLFTLLEKDKDERVRHFAFQMVEHIIKQFWNDIPVDSKVRLKTVCLSSMQQMAVGEPPFLSDAIARCTVEIVKREWPQQWPTFIDEMSSICSENVPWKTELVMRILLRLAEDVVTLNTLNAQRRKDIQSALNSAVVTIIPFLIQLFEANMQRCKLENCEETRRLLLQLTRTTLETIMGYVGWCDASLICCHDNKLTTLLFTYLSDVEIRLSCVECLLVISQRHGSLESISPVLVFFYEESLLALYTVIQQVIGLPAQEATHTFLKRLCQFTISMGEQLCIMWNKEGAKFKPPPSFPQYIQILLLLTHHDSLFIHSACFEFWTSLLRLNTDHSFKSEAVKALPALCLKRSQKVGSPSTDSPASYFARIDFDSEPDWLDAYHKSKLSMSTLLQLMQPNAEKQLLNMAVEEILRLYTISTHNPADVSSQLADCSSALTAEWAAALHVLHCVTRSMTLTADPDCLSLFQLMLDADVQEPQLLERHLSVLSALCPVIVSLSPDAFGLFLSKLFSCVQFKSSTPSDIDVELSRHAGAVFIKIATLYPDRLAPRFIMLHEYAVRCRHLVDSRTFRYLMEGLLLISNEMKCFEKQVDYIQLILEDSLKKWRDSSLQQSLQSPLGLASHIGLLSPPDSDPVFKERRFILHELLKDFLVVVKRVIAPADPQVAAGGGYVDREGVKQSPAAFVLLPQLNGLLQCFNSTMGLFRSDVNSKFHEGFPPSCVKELPAQERAQITGEVLPDDEVPSAQLAIQKHVLSVLDLIQQVLVNLCKFAPLQFYSFPEIAEVISYIVVHNVSELNSFTLKNIVKFLLKSYFLNCPAELSEVYISPVLHTVLPHIVSRLDSQWQQVKHLPLEEAGEEDKPTNEIIENELLRVISRELLDMCLSLFIAPPDSGTKQKKPQQTATDDVEMTDSVDSAAAGESKVTPYLKTLPQEDVLYLFWLACTSSCWADSLAAQKAIDMVLPLTQYLLTAGALTGDISEQVLRSLLTSVHMHGQHDYISTKLLSSIVSAYELLRNQFPDHVMNIMLQVPGVTQGNLQNYEHETGICLKPGVAPPKQVASAKRKKDKLKILISEIIGRNISEQFKERVVIKNLPPLIKKRLKAPDLISEVNDSNSVGLCSLFAPS